MTLRFFGILMTMLVVAGGASFYVHRRATRAAGLGKRGARALGVVLAVGVVSMIGARVLDRWLPSALLAPLGMLGSAIVVAALLSTPLLAIVDLVAASARLPARLGKQPIPAAPPPEALSRRDFVLKAATGTALAVGTGNAFYGTFFGRHDYAIEEVPIALSGLSKRLDGYTVVQLSDIHLGMFVGDPEMRAAEALVRRARPDLVVLTGDLVDHDPRYDDALGRLVRMLAPIARDGLVAIPGNHDYFTGWDAVSSTLERAGAVVLRNRGVVLGGAGASFALLGVDDAWGARVDRTAPGPDLTAALASVPPAADMPRILLCHNPVFFPKAAGLVDLQLSGHTHGGQVNLGIRPADFVLGHPYIAGKFEKNGSRLYVNRGFGTAGPPTRVMAAPEITRVILTA